MKTLSCLWILKGVNDFKKTQYTFVDNKMLVHVFNPGTDG